MAGYPIILNGDHAEFEREHANTPPEQRPDWPLPSFDARDWAKAFCKIADQHDIVDRGGASIDEGWMTSWFANALMRGYDEYASRQATRPLTENEPNIVYSLIESATSLARDDRYADAVLRALDSGGFAIVRRVP